LVGLDVEPVRRQARSRVPHRSRTGADEQQERDRRDTFQFTHDGLDFTEGPIPGDVTGSIRSGGTFTFDHFLNHDRLIRSRVLNLGGGVTYALSDSVGIFATATTMAWGRNIQRPRSATVGINWSFQTGRAASTRPSLTGRVLPPQ
jgi:hypothetical protein